MHIENSKKKEAKLAKILYKLSLKSVLIKINKNFAVFNCFLHFLKPFSLGKFSGDFLYFGGNLGEILKSSGERLLEGAGNPDIKCTNHSLSGMVEILF